MSIIGQKITVGILGLALFASVVTVGYVDASRKATEQKRAEFKPKMTPELTKGRQVYEKYSCVVCHGADCKGRLPNFNAQTGQKTPGLNLVADSYTKPELKEKIRKGVLEVERADPTGPKPPIHMPSFRGVIGDDDLDLLVNYLFSLMPPKEKDAW